MCNNELYKVRRKSLIMVAFLDRLTVWSLILVINIIIPLLVLLLGIYLIKKTQKGKPKILGIILVIIATVYFIWLTIQIIDVVTAPNPIYFNWIS